MSLTHGQGFQEVLLGFAQAVEERALAGGRTHGGRSCTSTVGRPRSSLPALMTGVAEP